VEDSFQTSVSKQPSQNHHSHNRTWNTPIREPWNPVIKQCLAAIDLHISLYIQTDDPWHYCSANRLRQYVEELKDWIVEQEGKTI
jgi:hypothetical protein